MVPNFGSSSAIRLRNPSLVSRECLRGNSNLESKLSELGLGQVIRFESASSVLMTTRDYDGQIQAAGVLLKSPYRKPEIHVRVNEHEIFHIDKHGQASVEMGVDVLGYQAAVKTWKGLRSIAHERNEWMIGGYSVGTPALNPDADFRAVHHFVDIPGLPNPQLNDSQLRTPVAC